MPSKALEKYRQETAEYALTNNFIRKNRWISKVVKPIRDKVIGIDLEGVLVSSTPHNRRTTTIELLREISTDEGGKSNWNLQRPHALALLRSLAKQNSVHICTALSRKHTEKILKLSSIKLPNSVNIIAKEDLTEAFKKNDLLDAYKNLYGKSTIRLEGGVINKIPSLHGFDALIDDNGKAHQVTCSNLDYPTDVHRIICVPPFRYTSLKELSLCVRDDGIYRIAKRLRDFFAKKETLR